jgi:hypothetical protein
LPPTRDAEHQLLALEWDEPLPTGIQVSIPLNRLPTAKAGDTVVLVHREDRDDRMGTVTERVETAHGFVTVSFEGWDS